MAVEQVAERLEPARQPLAAASSGREDRVHDGTEVLRQLSDQCPDQHVAAQSLPPERRPRTARQLGHPLEGQSGPAPLAEHLDSGPAKLRIDLHRYCSVHATLVLHKRSSSATLAPRRAAREAWTW